MSPDFPILKLFWSLQNISSRQQAGQSCASSVRALPECGKHVLHNSTFGFTAFTAMRFWCDEACSSLDFDADGTMNLMLYNGTELTHHVSFGE